MSSVLDGTVDPHRLGLAVAGSRVTAGPAILVVVVARTEQGGLGKAVAALVSAFPGAVEGLERHEPAVHVPVLVPDVAASEPLERRRRLRVLARQLGVTLVDTHPTDPVGARAAYRAVRGHLDLAVVAGGPSKLVSVDRLMRYGAVRWSCPEEAGWMTEPVIGPLAAASSPRWDRLATLYAVHDAEGDIEAAAAQLGRAPRTLDDHLDKIGALLHAHQGRPVSEIEIDLALRLHRIHATDPDEGDAASPR